MSVNWRALGKVLIIVGIILFGISAHHPAIRFGGLWLDDVQYYTHNNSTKSEFHNLSFQAKMALIVVPFYYILPIFSWYMVVTRAHRKKLIVNGLYEGVIMCGYGDARFKGHLYDLACIVYNRFRHITWDDFPTLISKDLYHGKIIIYYRQSILQSPIAWTRLMVATPSQIRFGIYSVFVTGRYQILCPHPSNMVLGFMLITDTSPYLTTIPDINTLKMTHRDTLKRIKQNNLEMLEGNPNIAGDMVKSSLFAVPGGVKKDFLDLLTDEEREEYIRASKGQS